MNETGDDDLHWRVADVVVRYSSRAAGDLRDAARRAAWLRRHAPGRRSVLPRQVHGTGIAVAEQAEQLAAADAVISSDPELALGVYGADCPGLCLVAPDALAVAHCGWRGCAAGLARDLVAALAARSAHGPGRWRALIGPGICAEHYEVDAPVLRARRWPAAAVSPSGPGRARLDLAAAIAADLHAGGVRQVLRTGVCTRCDARLHSYRQHGGGFSQALIAWRDLRDQGEEA